MSEEPLAAKYRKFSSQLSCAWALRSGSETLAELRPAIQVYEEIRVWMAKEDAACRPAVSLYRRRSSGCWGI